MPNLRRSAPTRGSGLALALGITLAVASAPHAVTAQKGGAAADPADPLAPVAWLAGRWVGEGLDGWNELLWSPPAAGSMMGVYRHVRDGAVVFYEILTLRAEDGRLAKTLRHFHADLQAWEEPDRTVRFPLVRLEPEAIVLEGMTYRRTGPDTMEITVMLGPDADHLRPEVFTYRRVGP